jgi:hypothetical protein
LPVRDTRLHQPPHRCGFTLRGEDPEGFFIGEVLSGWDPTAAISVSYARSLARELGYVHPDDHAQAIRDRDEARSEDPGSPGRRSGCRASSTRSTSSSPRASVPARRPEGRPTPKSRSTSDGTGNLALVAGSTTRFAVVDSERDLGYTIEGTLQVKVPKNSKPGAALEVVFVTDHVCPIDPLWDGQGNAAVADQGV